MGRRRRPTISIGQGQRQPSLRSLSITVSQIPATVRSHVRASLTPRRDKESRPEDWSHGTRPTNPATTDTRPVYSQPSAVVLPQTQGPGQQPPDALPYKPPPEPALRALHFSNPPDLSLTSLLCLPRRTPSAEPSCPSLSGRHPTLARCRQLPLQFVSMERQHPVDGLATFPQAHQIHLVVDLQVPPERRPRPVL